MQVIKPCIFSFSYVRRGQTNSWDRARGQLDPNPTGDLWRGQGVRLAQHNDKSEWIEVALERAIDTEDDIAEWLEEACDEAEDVADAEFKRRHPEATLT